MRREVMGEVARGPGGHPGPTPELPGGMGIPERAGRRGQASRRRAVGGVGEGERGRCEPLGIRRVAAGRPRPYISRIGLMVEGGGK